MPLPSEIVLLPFPFTDLSATKRRPVLVLKAGNAQGDFLAVQITSQLGYRPAVRLIAEDFELGGLPKAKHRASRQSLHPQQSTHRSAGWEADPIGFRADIGGGLSAGRLPRALRSRLRCMQLDPRKKESKHTDHWHVPAEPVREGSDTSFLGTAVTAILSGVGVPQRQPAFRRNEAAGSGAPLPGRSQARSWSTRYPACR